MWNVWNNQVWLIAHDIQSLSPNLLHRRCCISCIFSHCIRQSLLCIWHVNLHSKQSTANDCTLTLGEIISNFQIPRSPLYPVTHLLCNSDQCSGGTGNNVEWNVKQEHSCLIQLLEREDEWSFLPAFPISLPRMHNFCDVRFKYICWNRWSYRNTLNLLSISVYCTP